MWTDCTAKSHAMRTVRHCQCAINLGVEASNEEEEKGGGMSSPIFFFVPGLPQTKGSTKSFFIKKTNRVVTTNDNVKNKKWAAAVSAMAHKYKPESPWSGPVKLVLIFSLPIPKSLGKKVPADHVKKPDLSKLTRSVEDALTGIIYRDDSQIVIGHQKKCYARQPGVYIEIWH